MLKWRRKAKNGEWSDNIILDHKDGKMCARIG
jgi:hypothetical protein